MTAKTNAQSESALVIERVFDAPRDLVWKAWTEPVMSERWWGPKGYTSRVVTMDVRPGGKHFSCMRSPEGLDIWSIGEYNEVVPLERIVVTTAFADQNGNQVHASHYGMTGDDFPDQMRVTVTFEDQNGKTKLTLRHEGLPAGEHLAGANEGWSQSFDKLAAYLAEAQTQ